MSSAGAGDVVAAVRGAWQVRQAEQALRIYFLNFLQQTHWHQRQAMPSWTSKAGRVHRRPSNNCDRASEPGTGARTFCISGISSGIGKRACGANQFRPGQTVIPTPEQRAYALRTSGRAAING